jgi:hypothetical protein
MCLPVVGVKLIRKRSNTNPKGLDSDRRIKQNYLENLPIPVIRGESFLCGDATRRPL